jgi:hypothetical protein
MRQPSWSSYRALLSHVSLRRPLCSKNLPDFLLKHLAFRSGSHGRPSLSLTGF